MAGTEQESGGTEKTPHVSFSEGTLVSDDGDVSDDTDANINENGSIISHYPTGMSAGLCGDIALPNFLCLEALGLEDEMDVAHNRQMVVLYGRRNRLISEEDDDEDEEDADADAEEDESQLQMQIQKQKQVQEQQQQQQQQPEEEEKTILSDPNESSLGVAAVASAEEMALFSAQPVTASVMSEDPSENIQNSSGNGNGNGNNGNAIQRRAAAERSTAAKSGPKRRSSYHNGSKRRQKRKPRLLERLRADAKPKKKSSSKSRSKHRSDDNALDVTSEIESRESTTRGVDTLSKTETDHQKQNKETLHPETTVNSVIRETSDTKIGGKVDNDNKRTAQKNKIDETFLENIYGDILNDLDPNKDTSQTAIDNDNTGTKTILREILLTERAAIKQEDENEMRKGVGNEVKEERTTKSFQTTSPIHSRGQAVVNDIVDTETSDKSDSETNTKAQIKILHVVENKANKKTDSELIDVVEDKVKENEVGTIESSSSSNSNNNATDKTIEYNADKKPENKTESKAGNKIDNKAKTKTKRKVSNEAVAKAENKVGVKIDNKANDKIDNQTDKRENNELSNKSGNERCNENQGENHPTIPLVLSGSSFGGVFHQRDKSEWSTNSDDTEVQSNVSPRYKIKQNQEDENKKISVIAIDEERRKTEKPRTTKRFFGVWKKSSKNTKSKNSKSQSRTKAKKIPGPTLSSSSTDKTERTQLSDKDEDSNSNADPLVVSKKNPNPETQDRAVLNKMLLDARQQVRRVKKGKSPAGTTKNQSNTNINANEPPGHATDGRSNKASNDSHGGEELHVMLLRQHRAKIDRWREQQQASSQAASQAALQTASQAASQAKTRKATKPLPADKNEGVETILRSGPSQIDVLTMPVEST